MSEQPLTAGAPDNDHAFDARCAAWLEAMAGGDEKALEDFYDATLPRAFAVAVRILGDASTAEDVVADAYHDAWCRADGYEPQKGRPITWFLTICRNRSLDEYRRRAANLRKVEAAAAQHMEEHTCGPDTLLESVEQDHAVHALLLSIAGEDRQLLALAFFRGLSHQQISEVTQMPLGTVKSRIRRALATLERNAPGLLEV